MKLVWAVFSLILLTAAARAAEFPCKLDRFTLISPQRISFKCAGEPPPFSATAIISLGGAEVTRGTVSTDGTTIVLVDLQKPLKGGMEYEIAISAMPSPPDPPFEVARQKISTKANGSLTLPIRADSTDFRYGRELWIQSTNELVQPTSKRLTLYFEDAPGESIPHTARTNADRSEIQRYGSIRLNFDFGEQPRRLDAKMRIEGGIKDIFDQTVPVTWRKRAAPASSPKTKDDSVYCAKLLHQAGINSKPAFILDGKLAPALPIRSLRYIELLPSAIADIGQGGAIGKTKTNDLVQFGIGVGKFIRTERSGALQGISPAAGFAYETNYELVHKNAIFTSEAQWFIAGSDGSLKQKNFILYVHEKQRVPDTEPQDAPKAFFGYRFRYYTGVEAGTQISEEQAKASSGSSKVQIPKYSIARIYPKVSLALDFTDRLTLTLAGTGRYLFATENVYRERDVPSTTGGDPTKEVYLTTVSRFRPSGEVGLAFALDNAGHYALSSAVKLGSLPPNFVRVATVQTGLTLKF